MKEAEKILTYQQAKELKWFCKNVVGLREEYYAVTDKVHSFDERIARLEKTCALIEKFLGEKITPHERADWNNDLGDR